VGPGVSASHHHHHHSTNTTVTTILSVQSPPAAKIRKKQKKTKKKKRKKRKKGKILYSKREAGLKLTSRSSSDSLLGSGSHGVFLFPSQASGRWGGGGALLQ
jgi:hypothetical protein